MKLKAIFNINTDMYVCLCLGVTDREVQQAIREGACTVAEVARCSGAGSRCGGCHSSIAAMLAESRPLSEAASEVAEAASPSRRLHVLQEVSSAA
jgi:bacterioferritin-associated ferredoxin